MKDLLHKFENKEAEIVFNWKDPETDAEGHGGDPQAVLCEQLRHGGAARPRHLQPSGRRRAGRGRGGTGRGRGGPGTPGRPGDAEGAPPARARPIRA